MATTNYSLPTLESTALFDLVTDYNALANATDAALARVAGLIPTETITEMQGQISALQTLTGSQGTQITTLQSQMSTANGNISTLQSGLDTANSNIGSLQTQVSTLNSKVQNITGILTLDHIYVGTSSNCTLNASNMGFANIADGRFVLATNDDKSIIKIMQLPALKYTGSSQIRNFEIACRAFPNFGTRSEELVMQDYCLYSCYDESDGFIYDMGNGHLVIKTDGSLVLRIPYMPKRQNFELYAIPALCIVGSYKGTPEVPSKAI